MNIASRLRLLRREKRIRQSHIADRLELSVSEISRIERGRRRLRVDQLEEWADSLGYHMEVLLWESTNQCQLDDETRRILQEVAASLPAMPGPARDALLHEMRLWRQDAAAK